MRWDNYYSGERVHVDEKGFRIDIDVKTTIGRNFIKLFEFA